jgi:hypothetical protein
LEVKKVYLLLKLLFRELFNTTCCTDRYIHLPPMTDLEDLEDIAGGVSTARSASDPSSNVSHSGAVFDRVERKIRLTNVLFMFDVAESQAPQQLVTLASIYFLSMTLRFECSFP